MLGECKSLREHLHTWLDAVRQETLMSAVPVSTTGSEAGVRQSSIDLQHEREDKQSSISMMCQATFSVETEACSEQLTNDVSESQHSGEWPG